MIETVVALCMFVAGELKEHRIQPAMSECLKGKRVAERDANNNIQYKCGQGDLRGCAGDWRPR